MLFFNSFYVLNVNELYALILRAILLIILYFIAVFLPSPAISRTLNRFKKEVRGECGGKINAGKMIGYAERSLIYLIFLIAYAGTLNLASALNALSLIIAGKGLFRASNSRECTEWYILGTFMSIFLGTLITWIGLMIISTVSLW